MLVAPVPIIVSITVTKLFEVLIFSPALLNPHAVGLILAGIPFVIVIVSAVMITASFLSMIVVCGLRGGCEREWGDQSQAQDAGAIKTSKDSHASWSSEGLDCFNRSLRA